MTPDEFSAGLHYLCELRPTQYRAEEIRFWNYEQLAEELAAVALEEDPAPPS